MAEQSIEATHLMIDPPSGWMYGFPKPIPKTVAFAAPDIFFDWMIENGYPASLIDDGHLQWCRFWEVPGDKI